MSGVEQYRHGAHLMIDESLLAWTRKPEPGSLEDRHPGIARALIKLMYGTTPYFRWPHASPMNDHDVAEAFADLHETIQGLQKIAKDFKLDAAEKERFDRKQQILEQRLLVGIRNHNSFWLTSGRIQYFSRLTGQIQSDLLELVVSTFIDGEHFWFSQDVFEFYKGTLVNAAGKIKKHNREREIDIIVSRRDGSDLWVEIKNNSLDWTASDYANWAGISPEHLSPAVLQFQQQHEQSRRLGINADFLSQASAQLQIRKDLNLTKPINILWVSKYPLPIEYREGLTKIGVSTWSLHFSAKPIFDTFFKIISPQINGGQ